MLAVMLKIGIIDYEETLKAVFPWIAEQLDQQGSDHWTARLIRKLGDDAKTVALGVLCRLQKEMKNDLLVYCVNQYEQVLTRKANEALSRKYGSCFKIGALFMENDEGIYLQIRQIRVAYDSLPGQLLPHWMNSLIRMVAAAGRNGAESLEAYLPEFVCQKENRQKLIKEIQGILNQQGLIVQLDDMDVAQESGESPFRFRNDAGLNEKLKAGLCDAVAGYLKELL